MIRTSPPFILQSDKHCTMLASRLLADW